MYIDAAYLYALMGQGEVQGHFTDSGSFNDTRLDEVIGAADARVRAALRTAGYTPPSDAELTAMLASSDEEQAAQGRTIKLACFGAFLRWASGRKATPVPQEYADSVAIVRRIEQGDIRFPALAITERDAIGGVDFSESDEDVTDNRAPVFGRNMR